MLGRMTELDEQRREHLKHMHLRYGMDRPLVPNFDAGGDVAESWYVNTVEERWGDDGDETATVDVCQMHLVRAQLEHPDLWDALDAMEADLEMVASTVLDPSTGSLADELEERIEPMHDQMLILNSAVLAPEWRGLGIGALLAGMALQTLAPGARLAVTYPAPLNDAEGPARRAATVKLGRVWQQLGFEPFRDGVWVLDLALVGLDQGVAKLRKQFGLGN